MSYFSLFQSPHPVRGATGSRSCWPPSQCHFNPRTPRGVRLAPHAGGGAAILISIHAPREGCDTINQLRMAFQIQFQSTHPARGATSNDKRLEADELLFQSTHPARGATVCRRATMDVFTCFNPRTPRGVRRTVSTLVIQLPSSFNPRTPRGVRHTISTVKEVTNMFQSTHPARGATYLLLHPSHKVSISIHAPREGCDGSGAIVRPGSLDISIHAPREGCDVWHLADKYTQLPFQSTHPARGATALWL